MWRRARLIVACIGVSTWAFAWVGAAAARPRLSLTIANDRINAGSSIVVTYAASHLGSASLLLQRQVGTARIWKRALKLSKANGSASAPGLPIGRYQFRIAAFHRNRLLATSRSVAVYVYGAVSLQALCRGSGVMYNGNFGCPYTGSTQIGSNIFSYTLYVGSNGASVYPTYYDLVNFPSNTCRSISITFGIPNNGAQMGDTAYLEIVQETLDPQSIGVTEGSLNTLSAALDGHPWDLENAATNGNDGIAMIGTASCYSATGY